MSITEQNWFSKIRRPSRYLGNEINIKKKDLLNEELSIALVFPDLYEIGMSHQGLKILYHILNRNEWLTAERLFSPWLDLEKELRDRNIPLNTLESQRPLSGFDIIGFSLQHELCFTNLLNILDLADIPFLSAQRDDSYPLIIAGGPVCFNPEPIADIFDVIVIGDGEETALELCKSVRKAKKKGLNRRDLLHQLTEIGGIYIPAFFKIHYLSDGTIEFIEPLVKSYTEIKKAVVHDIDEYPFPFDQIVPFTKLVHDRLAIEISRGCTRGCRFCQAGMIYRPVRERNPESIIEKIDKSLRLTGYEEISLLSLSSGDYSCISSLLAELMDCHSYNKTAISLPSLRVDSLDPAWFDQIKRVRKTGFTLAPEAGNDDLRKVINKSLTNKEILHMARQVYEAGWNLIKLYFMIGLPTEKETDLQDIIQLSNQVAGLAGRGGDRIKVNSSISTFVPKAHTPFMWSPQITLEESKRRIRLIRDDPNKNHRVRVKWNQPELSWLEGVFSRGDRRLTQVIIEAWRSGARFDSWGDQFRPDIWEKSFRKCGIDPDFFLYRPRSLDETLPWEHICSGVTKKYLRGEWERALNYKTTPDCREGCLECGVCNHKELDPLIRKEWNPGTRAKGCHLDHESPETVRYKMTFSKTSSCKYLSHLELATVFIRAFRRARLNVVFSKGYHPLPKISFTFALPVGTESLHETLVVELGGKIQIPGIIEEINKQLPSGIYVKDIEIVPKKRKLPKLKESYFHITFTGFEIDPSIIDRFNKSETWLMRKNGKKGVQKIDARLFVKSITMRPPDSIILSIRHNTGPELKPAEIVRELFQLSDLNMENIVICKTKQVVI